MESKSDRFGTRNTLALNNKDELSAIRVDENDALIVTQSTNKNILTDSISLDLSKIRNFELVDKHFKELVFSVVEAPFQIKLDNNRILTISTPLSIEVVGTQFWIKNEQQIGKKAEIWIFN